MTVRIEKPSVNLREKLAELDKPTGIAGEAMLRAETPQEQFNLIGAGRRNWIINGGFNVWQRGTSFNSIVSQYCADRYYISRSNTVNIERVNCSLDGFKYAHRGTNVTAGDHTVYQKIENTGQFYVGQTLTLSMWVRSSSNVNVRIGRCYSTSGYVTSYDVVPVTTSWQYVTTTQTITSPWTGSEPSLDVQVLTGDTAYDAGTWFEITGVQLELGKVATPFEHRSYGEELALCQRYFVKLQGDGVDLYTTYGSGVVAGATTAIIHGTLPVSMRDVPDTLAFSNVQIYDGATTKAVSAVSAIRSSTSSWSADLTTATGLIAANPAVLRGNANASSYITASAEL